MRSFPFILICLLFSCSNAQQEKNSSVEEIPVITEDSVFVILPEFIVNRFDYPVGKPDGKGYFNAQKFGKNNHLGDDWNGLGGGDSDLGDPVFAIASGYVTFAQDHNPSWGNVIRITHFSPDGEQVESLYAHCNEMFVIKNQWVSIGDKIGTIGNAHGNYKAHLHLELRDQIGLPVGSGYATKTEGYLDPTEFIDSHRTMNEMN
jgi:murein DD-endopeptidase MepM/ murein hydrolase activator NlpD